MAALDYLIKYFPTFTLPLSSRQSVYELQTSFAIVAVASPGK